MAPLFYPLFLLGRGGRDGTLFFSAPSPFQGDAILERVTGSSIGAYTQPKEGRLMYMAIFD